MKEKVEVRLEKDEIEFIDELIKKRIFDSRSQLIRRAVREFLEKFKREFLA